MTTGQKITTTAQRAADGSWTVELCGSEAALIHLIDAVDLGGDALGRQDAYTGAVLARLADDLCAATALVQPRAATP